MHAVILSGGAGSRLWPAATMDTPKSFLKITDELTLLQHTLRRSVNLDTIDHITIVANTRHIPQIRTQHSQLKNHYPHLDFQDIGMTFLSEPCSKDTAAAIAAAALQIYMSHGPDELMLVLPIDHIITNDVAFSYAVDEAASLAQSNKIVTLGIHPSHPEVGYGYVEYRDNDIINFIEKPTMDRAIYYSKSENFLWNSGIFCFTANTILREMNKYCPNIMQAVVNTMKKSIYLENGMDKEIFLNTELFALTPSKSIDYAVMEKSQNMAVVPCDIGWSDIGNWNAVSKAQNIDAVGNNVCGNAILHDVTNCYINTQTSIVAAVGIDNLAIIETDNGFLVTDKNKANNVKNIVHQLNTNATKNKIQQFPWGTKQRFIQKDLMIVDQITILPGKQLTVDDNIFASSHWITMSGNGILENSNTYQLLKSNHSDYIIPSTDVTILNTGKETLIMFSLYFQ